MGQENELRNKAQKGLLWSALKTISNQGSTFLFGIILARILTPNDYGLIGILMVFISIISIFVDSGFSTALIRKEDKKPEDYDTEFYFNIIIGLCCYLLLFVASPYIADFYDIPLLNPILRILSIKLIIQSFTIVQTAVYSINLDFKTPAMAGVASNIAGGIGGIVLAYRGFGVWALVFQQLVGQTLTMIILWLKSKWRPSIRFSNESFHYMLGFGSRILVSSFIQTVYTNIYPLLIGRKFGAQDLGLYSKASQMAQFPSTNMSSILNSVTFPILSSINKDKIRLIRLYNDMLKSTCLVVFPIMIFLAVVARPIVLLILGTKWESSIVFLQILCFALMWQPISAVNQSILKVVNRPDLLLRLELIKRPIGIVIIIVSLLWGMIGVSVGTVLIYLTAFVADNIYASIALKLPKTKQFVLCVPLFFNSLLMGIVSFFPMFFIKSSIMQLLTCFLIALSYQALITRHLFKNDYAKLLSLVRNTEK